MAKIQRLVGLILQSPILDIEDAHLLKEVAAWLTIDDVNQVRDVNEAMKQQIDLESAVMYLRGKYRRHKGHVDLEKDLSWHTAGVKHGQRSSERTLDPGYTSIAERAVDIGDLVSLLTDLTSIILGRQTKLEHLSVNYRRELSGRGAGE